MKNNKLIMYVIISSIIVLLVGLFNFTKTIEEINNEAAMQEVQVESFITNVHNVADTLVTYAEEFMVFDDPNVDDELFESYVYSEEYDIYYIDHQSEETLDGISLTSLNPLPTDDLDMQELNMAVALEELFAFFYKSIPAITYIFYTSENEFTVVYPYLTLDEYTISEDTYTADYYQKCTPENNPTGEAIWTDVYEDTAGEEAIFSVSQPVYYQEDFLGVITIEFTNKEIQDALFAQSNCYIFNKYDQLVGTNDEHIPLNLITMEELTGMTCAEISEQVPVGTGDFLNGEYVYNFEITGSDYFIGFISVPIEEVIKDTFAKTIPVILFCITLVLALIQFNKGNERAQEEEKARLAFEKASTCDPLTGAYNRRKFDAKYAQDIRGNSEDSYHLALIDLDFFKKVNDDFGHATGDQVLIGFTELLKETFAGHKMNAEYYRIGGEEFAIIFSNLSNEEVLIHCENLRSTLEGLDFGLGRKVTISAGVTGFVAGEDMTTAYKRADHLLYDAKESGRNNIKCDI